MSSLSIPTLNRSTALRSRRIVFHVGPAKTGTSSLQEALYAARVPLAEQGYIYPSQGRHDQMPRAAGHHGLPAVLNDGGHLPAPFLEAVAAVPADQTVVLSSENLAHLGKPQIARLMADLAEIGITPEQIAVVYYARRWDHLLPSVWQELVKHGTSRSYLSFLNQQATAPRASLYLNYAITLERWGAVCGRENLHLYGYDQLRHQERDIISHFTEDVLGVALPEPEPEPEPGAGGITANTRWPVTMTEVLRALNRLSFGQAAEAGRGTAEVRRRLMEGCALVATELAELEALLTPFVRRCWPCAPLVLQALENATLAQFDACLRNPTPEGRLFDASPFKEAEYVEESYLWQEAPRALLHQIHQRLDLPGPAEGAAVAPVTEVKRAGTGTEIAAAEPLQEVS